MDRRQFVQLMGAAPALLLGPKAEALELFLSNDYYLKCLGHVDGPRYLDGRTHDGTVGLVPDLVKPFSGTRWRPHRVSEGIVAFRCQGDIEGNRWLDGNTGEGKVGLAPHTREPFSGTRWQIVDVARGVNLKCMGKVDGPRWLDGNTGAGIVSLAATTEPPFTGTRWELKIYPVCFDDPCPLP